MDPRSGHLGLASRAWPASMRAWTAGSAVRWRACAWSVTSASARLARWRGNCPCPPVSGRAWTSPAR